MSQSENPMALHGCALEEREFQPTPDAAEGRGGRMTPNKFGERPNSIGANMTPEMRNLARKNRREYDDYAASMESWYSLGCGPAFWDDQGSYLDAEVKTPVLQSKGEETEELRA